MTDHLKTSMLDYLKPLSDQTYFLKFKMGAGNPLYTSRVPYVNQTCHSSNRGLA